MSRGDLLAGLAGLGMGLALVCAWVGVPRIYATGCDWAPAITGGLQLAQEEDDLEGRCDRVEALPWARWAR